jgi:tRNA 2-thiouridine synthesizing protein A
MMSDNTIDARGLSCPQPVLMTQQAIKNGEKNFEVLVNSEVSKENVLRCINKNKLTATVREEGEDFILTVTE